MRRPVISPSSSRVFPPRGSKRRVAQSPRVARRLCRAQQQWHAFGRQKGWTISSRLVRCVQMPRIRIQRHLTGRMKGMAHFAGRIMRRFPGPALFSQVVRMLIQPHLRRRAGPRNLPHSFPDPSPFDKAQGRRTRDTEMRHAVCLVLPEQNDSLDVRRLRASPSYNRPDIRRVGTIFLHGATPWIFRRLADRSGF
jgi:hypothetical protein